MYKCNRINNNIVLEGNQAKFYQFFEVNDDKAYTLRAFIDCYFGVEEGSKLDSSLYFIVITQFILYLNFIPNSFEIGMEK